MLSSKIEKLRRILREIGSGVVAFSGGLDSSLLLYLAFEELGENIVALTVISPTYPEYELKEAMSFASRIGVRHYIRPSNELSNPLFIRNYRDRCYHCKKELIRIAKDIAKELDIGYIMDGSNFSDLNDHRPGLLALMEERVRSPLMEVELTKEEIRLWSKEIGLSMWKKGSQACLASRFPYGTPIEAKSLKKVEMAEEVLRELGFNQFRVRYHNELARIEVGKEEIDRFLNKNLREFINIRLKEIGFTYIALDLQGYRTGSLNEPKLNDEQLKV